MGIDSNRGYTSHSVESTLRPGYSQPIGNGNMELGAARPPHRPPRGRRGGVEVDTGHQHSREYLFQSSLTS